MKSSFDANTTKFNIRITTEELAAINEILAHSKDANIISKKRNNVRYTLIKSANNEYYLIGDGERELSKNAFLGAGVFGRVKIAIKLEQDANQKFNLTEEVYAVKIRGNAAKHNAIFFAENLVETECIKRLYDFSELITDEDLTKFYMIIPYLPGTNLFDLNYHNLNAEDIITILTETVREFVIMGEKGVLHGDIKLDNILYDQEHRKIYFIDFNTALLLEQPNARPVFKQSDELPVFLQRVYKMINKVYFGGAVETEKSALDLYEVLYKILEEYISSVINNDHNKNLAQLDIETLLEPIKPLIKDLLIKEKTEDYLKQIIHQLNKLEVTLSKQKQKAPEDDYQSHNGPRTPIQSHGYFSKKDEVKSPPVVSKKNMP